MAGRHNWNSLVKKMAPQRRARVQQHVRDDLTGMLLSELRKQMGLTQTELAEMLGVKQPTLSHLESQDDMQISTLRRIVEALGGEVDIVVTLPTGRVALSQFKSAAV